MATMTYTDISTLLVDIWEGALVVARDNNLMASLVRNFNGQGMQPRKSSIYGTLTFAAVAETDDIVAQEYSRSAKSTLTPAEAAASAFISDQRVESDDQGIVGDTARELGVGLAQKIEIDLLGNFSSLTGGTVGTAGSVLTWGIILAAQSRLRAANAPMPYTCVLHPYQWHDLATTISVANTSQVNAPGMQDQLVRNFFMGGAYGIDFFVTSNIGIDGNADAYGALFARDAMAFDVRRAPRLESERDASRRGLELVMSTIYGQGVWRPEWGVAVLSDATAPSY